MYNPSELITPIFYVLVSDVKLKRLITNGMIAPSY